MIAGPPVGEPARQTRSKFVMLRLTAEEHDWLKHAARLSHLSVAEYTRTAINRELRRQGVDAVLLKEKADAHL